MALIVAGLSLDCNAAETDAAVAGIAHTYGSKDGGQLRVSAYAAVHGVRIHHWSFAQRTRDLSLLAAGRLAGAALQRTAV